MSDRTMWRSVGRVLAGGSLSLALCAGAAHAAATEIKGAAILDHPCGKVSAKHMALVHAGKMDEAVKLGTKEMQDQWKAMSADDHKMMGSMMKEMSQSDADYAASVKASGVLAVDGKDATLTIKKEHKDANGTSSESFTQKFLIDPSGCWITH